MTLGPAVAFCSKSGLATDCGGFWRCLRNGDGSDAIFPLGATNVSKRLCRPM